jgi:hypothetical protein
MTNPPSDALESDESSLLIVQMTIERFSRRSNPAQPIERRLARVEAIISKYHILHAHSYSLDNIIAHIEILD